MSNLELATALYLNQQPQAALNMALADIGPLFNIMAASAQSLGMLEDAEKYWRMLLELEPNNPDAFNNLGLLLMEKGQFAEAESYFQQALSAKPDFAIALNNMAIVLSLQNRQGEAELALRRSLELAPNFPEARNNLGEILQNRGLLAEAEFEFQQALLLNPEYTKALFNLSIVKFGLNQWAEAEPLLLRLAELNPHHADAFNNLGIICRRSDRLALAEQYYRKALEIVSDHSAFLGNLGEVVFKLGRYREADDLIQQALKKDPDSLDCWSNLSLLYIEENRWAEAKQCLDECLRINSHHASSFNSLGVVQENLLNYDEAESWYKKAVALEPQEADFIINLGALQVSCKKFLEAESATRKALSLNPDSIQAQVNLAFILLHQGRYQEAWPYYEARFRPELGSHAVKVPELPIPPWRGEPLMGKHLLIWHEQGFGDDIQFCRYITEIKSMGARQIDMVCKPPLLPLLETVTGVDILYPEIKDTELPKADYWVFPMSILKNLNLTPETIPANLPYLHPIPERLAKWQKRLPLARPKVGLVWQGNTGYVNDSHRSLPSLNSLAPLAAVPNIQFISLQKGAAETEALNPPAGMNLFPVGPDLEDFADTAAVIEQLDLVITVDTAVGHLSGALGKPCWIMLPFYKTDWRWMQEREDTPWYPQTVRLFRQGKGESWQLVIERVAQALLGRFAIFGKGLG